MIADLRYALRMLLKSPGFALVAVLSLALGIGANTAIFSIMNAILLRSLPVLDPHELLLVNWSGTNVSAANFAGSKRTAGNRSFGSSFSYPAYSDMRERSAGMAEVFAFHPVPDLTAQTSDQAGVAQGLMVSGNFFHGYGAHALIGRTLSRDDERPGAAPVAVVTHRFWQERFGMDPKAVGQTLGINRNNFTIVGVLPRDYAGPETGDPADIYVPLSAQPQLRPSFKLASYDDWWLQIMARREPGADARKLNETLVACFRQALEQSGSKAENPAIELTDGSRGLTPATSAIKPILFVLQGIVAVILLIACANLAGLLLARGEARRREFAICAAIGARRSRLIRQMLAESLLLAGAGGAAGLLCSAWIKAGLMRMTPDFGLSLHLDTRLDARVLFFTGAVVLATALLCGLLPAWRASRVDPARDLQDGRSGRASRQRLGRALVATQVALSLLLVAVSGLFLRSIENLRAIDSGFDGQNVLLFSLRANQAGITREQRLAFFDRTREALATIPGVKAVAASDVRFVAGRTNTVGYSIPGREPRAGKMDDSNVMAVTDGFFEAMGIAVKRGREFAPADARGSEPAAVVNEAFAVRNFPGEDPVGLKINMGGKDYRIVGVCASTFYSEIKAEKPAAVFLAARQQNPSALHFAVRCVLPPLSIVPAARKAVAAIDPAIPLTDISTQEAQFDRSLYFERLFSTLCGSLAVLAVLLSCIGLYGLLAHNVARRRAEIGVRMALGARPGDVVRKTVFEALRTAAWGIGFGLPLTAGLGSIARKAFYGVEPYDPLTMGGAVVCLLAAAALASWLPARRAAKVDPMTALRAE